MFLSCQTNHVHNVRSIISDNNLFCASRCCWSLPFDTDQGDYFASLNTTTVSISLGYPPSAVFLPSACAPLCHLDAQGDCVYVGSHGNGCRGKLRVAAASFG